MTVLQRSPSHTHPAEAELPRSAGRRHATRILALGAALLGAGASLTPIPAGAQGAYPTRQIRVVVPFPPGTSPDVVARAWAEKLRGALGQPVVIDNRPGAATIIGAQAAASAPADGYTLLYTAQNTVSINPFVYRNLPYKADDFVPITRVAEVPLVMIVPASSPIRSVADLIRAAKDKPGKLNFASYGIGQGTHVAMVRFLNSVGATMVHVPYRDGGMQDVIAGNVEVSFDASTTTIPQIQAGKLRALAVSSARRLAALPDVPTVSELLPGFLADSWTGVLARKGTPPEVIARISAETLKILAADDFRKRLTDVGLTPAGGSPADFARFIDEESKVWAKVVADNAISVE
ncbi:MAG: tripartite tricarboxylate transporter substrate binding protein [Betaproteobacteria bacterium]|nr:tripartite tricarboxylate transporter substrate binding protein [Betaproteobacteria bacterium]